jgi:hypothetical protein
MAWRLMVAGEYPSASAMMATGAGFVSSWSVRSRAARVLKTCFRPPAPCELLGVNDALDRLIFVECAHACAGNAAVAPDLQLGLTSRVLIAQREFLH